jgi:PadR family transcriptional regulator AphA
VGEGKVTGQAAVTRSTPPTLTTLSLSDWVVLCLVAEGPTHGFAIAQLTASSGAVGRVWRVPKPVVYRALDRLLEHGLIAEVGTESGGYGPQRTRVQVTAGGKATARRWLHQPVRHVRDTRSELLLKLALLERTGAGTGRLLAAQLRVLEPIVEGLAEQHRQAQGFDQVLGAFRLENARAALAFVQDALHQRA